MFEEKKAISFPFKDFREIEFNVQVKDPETNELKNVDQTFKVTRSMTNEVQATIIGIYLNHLFDKNAELPEYNLITAKNYLIINLIDMMTDIQPKEDDLNNLLANMDLIKNIESAIDNYDEFSQRLYATVEMVKETRQLDKQLEKSLGTVLENIFAKANSFLDTISNVEGMSAVIESAKGLLKETQDSPLVRATTSVLNGEEKA